MYLVTEVDFVVGLGLLQEDVVTLGLEIGLSLCIIQKDKHNLKIFATMLLI